jgi:hypothetical protein
MSMRNDLRFGGGVTTMWGASAPVRSWSRYEPSADGLGLKSSPMHSWLAIFFMLLVPLQFASAGLEAYCLESAGVATSHGDHHPHTCQVDEGDDGMKGQLHADCGFCQILASAALLDAGRLPLTGLRHVLVDAGRDFNASALVTEPERPKWRRAA